MINKKKPMLDDLGFPAGTSNSDVYIVKNTGREELAAIILESLRRSLAWTNGKSPEQIIQLLGRISNSTKVLKILDKSLQERFIGVIEVLNHECTVISGGVIDFSNIPILTEYSQKVRGEFLQLKLYCSNGNIPSDAHTEWANLVEIVQRNNTKEAAKELIKAIDDKRNLTDIMDKFRAIEAPTTKSLVGKNKMIGTAKEYLSHHRSATAGRPQFRFSSGLPTLDRGYTGTGEAKGFISPGQLIVVMGPTGTGKTSFSYSVTPAFGLDLLNWGLKDATQIMWHTEEETIDKLKGFRMDVGDKYHHLANNLVIDAIGTSRSRMAESIYDLVIQADEKARKLKRPITDFLPYIAQLDYLQSVQESGENEVQATSRTAEFLLRGVCAWNPEEMAKFSNVSFQEYAGMPWPTGMENHRVAVLAYAQLVKIDDESLYYRGNKRGVQLSDFSLLDDKDNAYWEVKEGDLRLFGKNQMRGSGIIAQNAHAIVILHRSVPYNNPSKKFEDGEHLTDTRARILFDKSRAGSKIPYAPMRFDIQQNKRRTQYYDELAELAMEQGKLTDIDESYTELGDPILPKRPIKNPLDSFRY